MKLLPQKVVVLDICNLPNTASELLLSLDTNNTDSLKDILIKEGGQLLDLYCDVEHQILVIKNDEIHHVIKDTSVIFIIFLLNIIYNYENGTFLGVAVSRQYGKFRLCKEFEQLIISNVNALEMIKCINESRGKSPQFSIHSPIPGSFIVPPSLSLEESYHTNSSLYVDSLLTNKGSMLLKPVESIGLENTGLEKRDKCKNKKSNRTKIKVYYKPDKTNLLKRFKGIKNDTTR